MTGLKCSSLILSLQLASSPLSFCPPLVAQMITACLQTGDMKHRQPLFDFDSPAFLSDKTHTHTFVFVQVHACKCAHWYISWIHMPVHTGTNTHSLTHRQMHGRIHGSQGGWCAALRSRIGSSASCELDSPGSVLIPGTLFTSPHKHTLTHHTPSPSPAEGFAKFVLFVCSCLSSLSVFSFFVVSIRPSPFLFCDHRSQRPYWKLPSITSVSRLARTARMGSCVCLHVLVYPWLDETCVPVLFFLDESKRPQIFHQFCDPHEIKHPCSWGCLLRAVDGPEVENASVNKFIFCHFLTSDIQIRIPGPGTIQTCLLI